MIRPHVTTRILWQGNAINCNKSFATLRCTLCMQERLKILRRSASKKQKKLMTSLDQKSTERAATYQDSTGTVYPKRQFVLMTEASRERI